MARGLLAPLLLLCLARLGLADCGDEVEKGATCAKQAYSSEAVLSRAACCALCGAEPECAQWTFHALTRRCERTRVNEDVAKGPFTLFATCGIKKSPGPAPPTPPAPAPPAPGTASRWAVIAAGSSGYSNYRHQADACHAYQIMKRSGIPEDHIILMMQDDVAHSSENHFPGKLFNRPGMNATDVYHGCKVDYRGDIVTAKLFLSVITGDESGVPANGKVLKSGPNDRVFLNFIDHGGVGIIAFPNGPLLHVSELSSALKQMQSKDMFKDLLFYMEACESGSMFPGLTQEGKIFAVTASNAKESSWGYYCMPNNDTVNGKQMDTCLGDLFSISWMEDSDLGHLSSEAIKEQVARVTARTTKSHVSTFGDGSFEGRPIGGFESLAAGAPVPAATWLPVGDADAVSVRDIPVRAAYYAWERAAAEAQRGPAWDRLQRVVAGRRADEELFHAVAKQACKGGGLGCTEGIERAQLELQDMDCHRDLVRTVHEACPRRGEHNSGGWNDFNMRFSQVLVNLCESQTALRKDADTLQEIVRTACAAAALSPLRSEIVV